MKGWRRYEKKNGGHENIHCHGMKGWRRGVRRPREHPLCGGEEVGGGMKSWRRYGRLEEV